MDKVHVEKIAHLARLAIDEKDRERYAHDLSNILDLVQQMEEVETTGVTPMSHPLDSALRLRADEMTETDQRERFQENAPLVDGGLYLVPKVIE